MNCLAASGILDLHREGRLSPARSLQVARHLDSCARCAAAPVALTGARPAAPAPAAFKERLLRAAAAPAQPRESRPRRAAPPVPLIALAALALSLAAAHALLSGMSDCVRASASPAFSVRSLP